ncbi:hypothetical protein M3J09_007998 [Ascochyta lentis]
MDEMRAKQTVSQQDNHNLIQTPRGISMAHPCLLRPAGLLQLFSTSNCQVTASYDSASVGPALLALGSRNALACTPGSVARVVPHDRRISDCRRCVLERKFSTNA